MFAHLCCWFHRIASYCAGVVSPTLFHFLRITFLISCNSFFFFVRCRLLDITFHWNSEFGLFIYININRLYGELKNRCVVKFCEKFEKRIIEMNRWKKSILHALMFFREGEKVNMFFNTNTLINNCHSGSMHTKTLSTNNNDCLSIWRWFA